MKLRISLFPFMLLASMMSLIAAEHNGYHMEILVNSNPAPEYFHNGKIYIEALKGREYSLRLRNPLNQRVAVAVAVDGLNTIDGRHTTALEAKKWVLEPFATITLQGWQVNQKEARSFFFTTEERSYGKWYGNTQNLGLISAVFFKEGIRPEFCPELAQDIRTPHSQTETRKSDGASPRSKNLGHQSSTGSNEVSTSAQKQDEFAATGIGKRSEHLIQWVPIELDSYPEATLNIRYEFKPVLIGMGILTTDPSQDPINRREQARGFDQLLFCPEPRQR